MSLGLIGNNIPKHWKSPLLVDLVTPKQWKTIPTKNLIEKGYVVYGANGKIGFYSEYTHEKPTLMITCRGATCGNLHISEPCSYINGNAMALDSQPTDLVSLEFLFYALKARGLEDTISGSAQPQITGKGLQEVGVPLPPLAEQKVITVKIDALLAQVEVTKARLESTLETLKQFRQSVLAAAVSGKLTEGWRDRKEFAAAKPISSIAKDIRYGTSKKCSPEQIGTPVLRIPNITNGKISLDDLKYAKFDEKELAKLSLKSGDLLLIRSNGSVDLVGKNAVISQDDEHCLFAGYLIRVRLDSSLVDSHYVSFCLNSPQLRQVIEVNARSTSGVNNINSKELAALEIPLPQLKEQQEIVRRVEKLFAGADATEQQVNQALERVNNLTQSILAKAFRGELTEQWRKENPELISGDNSAEALLKKIKAERAATKPKRKARTTSA
ncbi:MULTISPECIES: restriction endonuclease subunit S [Vibrio]|uniref:restriction endonuclease subunit S n=1 Tax=Vibrio TaxID=662 RepID=UPI001F030C3C|nr:MULTISPECIES: restriction endonuclease subunit S [Vibrio]MCF7478290.1 restriction endonuclease subunit S [Vibrio sp. J2-4]MCS0303696.1 restriction endonuclease subunit S [Vibrio diabolicus]MDF5064634.1 restriction endonuclease subunit S [Vibrio parahaemolyticus]